MEILESEESSLKAATVREPINAWWIKHFFIPFNYESTGPLWPPNDNVNMLHNKIFPLISGLKPMLLFIIGPSSHCNLHLIGLKGASARLRSQIFASYGYILMLSHGKACSPNPFCDLASLTPPVGHIYMKHLRSSVQYFALFPYWVYM